MMEHKTLSFLLALLVVTLLLSTLMGCAGTDLGNRGARFIHEYCDASLLTRQAARTQINATLEAYAAAQNPPVESDYGCFDCGGTTGDECKDRSKP